MSSSDCDRPGHRSRLQHTPSGILTSGKSLLGRNCTQRKSDRTVSVAGLPIGTFEPTQHAELLVLPVWGSWDQNQTKHQAKLHRTEPTFSSQLPEGCLAVSLHLHGACTAPGTRGYNLTVPLYRGEGRKREACTIKTTGARLRYHRRCLGSCQWNAEQLLHAHSRTRKCRHQSPAMA